MHDIQKLVEDVGDMKAQQKALEEIESMADPAPVWIGCIQHESRVRRCIGIKRLTGMGLRSFAAINVALESSPEKTRIARAFGSILRLIRLEHEGRILETDMGMVKELADRCIAILGDAEYIRNDFRKLDDYYCLRKKEREAIVWKLKNGDPGERNFAAESLGLMGYPSDMQLLIDHLGDEDREVRWNVATSIATIEQSNPGTLDIRALKERLDFLVRHCGMHEDEAGNYYGRIAKIMAREKPRLRLPFVAKEKNRMFRVKMHA